MSALFGERKLLTKSTCIDGAPGDDEENVFSTVQADEVLEGKVFLNLNIDLLMTS